MRKLPLLALLACLLALAGCDLVGRKPVHPFIEAKRVDLIVSATPPDGSGPVTETRQRTLSAEDRRDYEALLFTRPVPDRGELAACFVPHHFFRYFDARGRQVGEISICFCCDGAASSGNIPAGRELGADYGALEKLLRKWGVSTDVNC